MCKFVGHNLGPSSIPFDNSGREEHHPGVLHAAIRETHGQHQEIKSLPFVRPKELLTCLDHLLGASKLSGGLFNNGRFSINPGSGANVPENYVANSECKKVRRDGLVHDEVLDNAARGAPEGVGAGGAALAGEGIAAGNVASGHDGREGGRDVEEGGEADARGGSVVTGEEGAGVDGLALGVGEGGGLGGGRRQEVEGGGGVGGE